MTNGDETEEGTVRVLVEVRVPSGDRRAGMDAARGFDVSGFDLDEEYEPVPMEAQSEAAATLDLDDEEVVVVRGKIPSDRIEDLEAQESVVSVSTDARIEPFAVTEARMEPELDFGDFDALQSPPVRAEDAEFAPDTVATGTCPTGSCDCNPGTPKGDMGDVASYLGVDDVWSTGYRGNGIVVGVVDGGIAAQGRTSDGEIPRVVDGWPDDWGTQALWGRHGNMCATDVLGMAPEAQLYDLRIAGAPSVSGLLSDALAAYDWAIRQYRRRREPQILTNSWGIYQKSWAPDYATEIDHPFTRKVSEAINEGITVLFAAGNCGGTCPSGRCGSDSGPGQSIWGANGHPQVVTVGAVNTNDDLVGYSSQGPAALDPHKPDVLSVSHFRGYFNSDTGTSAATPIAAGVLALLEQADRGMSPEELKSVLKWTARDFGPSGWDRHSGTGVVRADQALERVRARGRRDYVYPGELRITGTQFRADIQPGQVQRWFTHSWPSEYVADWSVRPTSPDGRLDWSVDIKRQDDGDLTYFITIENVGSVETGLEAKYMITR